MVKMTIYLDFRKQGRYCMSNLMKFENCEYTLSCPKEMITDLNDGRK